MPFSFGGLVQATFMGAVSGAVTCGIGEAFTTVKSFALRATYSALAHGTFQGAMSGVQGGKFWSSFASGAISSLAASAFQFDGNGATEGLGWANSVRGSTPGMIAFGTIMGGVGASISKGNFWQGAATGFIVSALNHAMHDGDNDNEEYDQEDPKQKVHPRPDASELDKKFDIGNKDWEKKGGRWTITTKKEILQWDSQHGEVEVYSRGQKAHLGGANPKDRSIMTKPKSGRIPNGGWKITTSKTISLMKNLSNFLNLPAFNLTLPPLFELQMQSVQGYTAPN